MTIERPSRFVPLALLVGVSTLAGCIHERIPIYPTNPPPPGIAAPAPAPAPKLPSEPPPAGAVTDQVGYFARFTFLFAGRWFDSSWDPFDDQYAFQFGGTHEFPSAPVGVEWAFGFSSRYKEFAGIDFSNQNFEASVGLTKTFHLGGGHWFTNVGAGLAWTYTEEGEVSYCCGLDGHHDDWWAGYAHAALIYRVALGWDITVDLRGLTGEDVELGQFVLDGEYVQLGIGMGVGF